MRSAKCGGGASVEQSFFGANLMARTFVLALAVGLDVLAISVGVGIAQIAWKLRVRLGLAFTFAELLMQVLGYGLGTGVGRLLGEAATYGALTLLAAVGILMIRSSFRADGEGAFDATRGTGLVMAAASISLDSLGVGIALPAVGIPLIPLLLTLSVTTSIFTFVGIAFGAKLGERYEHGAERLAGSILIVLAILFLIEHSLGRSPV
jgi:manganese efflux pump family protein